MRPNVTAFVKLSVAAVGAVAATYGTLALEGKGFLELVGDPNFWMVVCGTLATAIAFEAILSYRRGAAARDDAGRAAPGPADAERADAGAGTTPADTSRTAPGRTGHPDVARTSPAPGAPDDRNRLSLLEVVGLSAGGVLGSGWLLAAYDVQHSLGGGSTVLGWLTGAVLMSAVAVVMVEFGLVARRTGGLLFHPQDVFGPLVVLALAGTLWIAYAVNPVAQSVAAARALGDVVGGLVDPSTDPAQDAVRFTGAGTFVVLAVLVAILAFVALPKRLVLQSNAYLTVAKIAIAVLLVAALASVDPVTLAAAPAPEPTDGQDVSGNPLAALLASGIIYAYIGFQAPLDVTGEIRTTGRTGVNSRVRWAVYGTVVGSFLLYVSLQTVYDKHAPGVDVSYAQIAGAAARGGDPLAWLEPLAHFVSVASPIGSGIVFAYVLTREVFALSGERYVPRALHARWANRIPGTTFTSHWLILLVNLGVCLAILATAGDHGWDTLHVLNTIPILVIYSVSCVVLFVRADLFGDGPRRHLLSLLAYLAFVGVALAIHESSWDHVWKGMTVIAVGTAAMLVLPWLARQGVPGFRWYDANRSDAFRDPAARRPFWILLGYLATLTGLNATRLAVSGRPTADQDALEWALRLALCLVASATFVGLTAAAQQYSGRRQVSPARS